MTFEHINRDTKVQKQQKYMRNIVGIIPNGSDICSNADIPELGVIGGGELNMKGSVRRWFN